MLDYFGRRKIVITGPSGIGKTTIIKQTCRDLNLLDIPVLGFYTEEVKKNRVRVGFDAVSMDGQRCPLARVKSGDSQYSVGKYTVYVSEFEDFVKPIFEKIEEKNAGVVVLDEIGKMELLSTLFSRKINSLFKNDNLTLLTTIPLRTREPIPVLERIRNDTNNALFVVNKSNRDCVPHSALDLITEFV